jgi:hypothetical protein
LGVNDDSVGSVLHCTLRDWPPRRL